MKLLSALALAEKLFSAGMATGNVVQPPKSRMVQGFLFLAMMLGIVSFVFFMIALNAWLQTGYSKEAAALMTALASLASAVVVGLSVFAASLYRQMRMLRIKRIVKKNATNFFQSAARELDDPIRDHPGLSAAVATIVGFLIARKII